MVTNLGFIAIFDILTSFGLIPGGNLWFNSHSKSSMVSVSRLFLHSICSTGSLVRVVSSYLRQYVQEIQHSMFPRLISVNSQCPNASVSNVRSDPRRYFRYILAYFRISRSPFLLSNHPEFGFVPCIMMYIGIRFASVDLNARCM